LIRRLSSQAGMTSFRLSIARSNVGTMCPTESAQSMKMLPLPR
jgi:hypothetical protein